MCAYRTPAEFPAHSLREYVRTLCLWSAAQAQDYGSPAEKKTVLDLSCTRTNDADLEKHLQGA